MEVKFCWEVEFGSFEGRDDELITVGWMEISKIVVRHENFCMM